MTEPRTSGLLWPVVWLAFSALLLAVGIITSLGFVIASGFMGLVAAAISWAWNRLSAYEVSYERHVLHERVFLGDAVEMTVALTNRKAVPLAWIRVDDSLPQDLDVEGDRGHVSLSHLTAMAWFERIVGTAELSWLSL